MSAQPNEDRVEDPLHDPYDPHAALGILPEKYHESFWAESKAAWQEAEHPDGYGQFRKFLRLWRLRAGAYSDPGYEDRLEAAFDDGVDNSVPAEAVDHRLA